jgi:hypothetical protein
MNACTSFCAAFSDFLGPTLANWILMALAAVFLWLKAHKKIAAAVAPLEQRAVAAEAKVADLQTTVAKIEGSLRPAALPPTGYTPVVPPVIGKSSSQSGNFEPVTMPELDASTPKPRPSMPDPNLINPVIPRASAVPSIDDEGGK